jgi:hypothetical protein
MGGYYMGRYWQHIEGSIGENPESGIGSILRVVLERTLRAVLAAY